LYAYRRALAMKEEALGPSDWDVAVTLDQISEFYYQQARYNDAEPLMWRSIEIQTAVLGQGAPLLAKRYIKLGTLYATQRKYTEAERLLRYGISISPATETAEDIGPCLHKLAEVYEGLARFRSAEGVRSLAHALCRPTRMPRRRSPANSRSLRCPFPVPQQTSIPATRLLFASIKSLPDGRG